MRDKISVIVAVYNVRSYIERCIDSILSQNCKGYEIILVDDGSTDGSGEVLCEYFKENPRKIRLLRQENQGLSAARNAALAIADGEYVTFVDGDDYLEKNALQTLLSEIKREGADIAVSGFFEDFPGFSKEISFRREILPFDRAMELISAHDGYKFAVVWGKLYRRELFSTLEFPKGKIHEDQYIIHKLYYDSKKTVTIDKRLYHHTNREDSISRASGFAKHTDDLDALFLRSDFLRKNGMGACLAYVARHMLYLLDFYLRRASPLSHNALKCRYIKRVMRFVRENLGRSSDIYRKCQALYIKRYFKYKILSYVYG